MVIISFYLLVIYHLSDVFVLCYGFAVLFVFWDLNLSHQCGSAESGPGCALLWSWG